ncbi:MAG: hypothetical protein JSW58_11520 [Candidatus Latescibacterota bacterium]|nr:MAG: hypothetical protein JSW58_11520 [Candidatus Latescibacterota bacterium]
MKTFCAVLIIMVYAGSAWSKDVDDTRAAAPLAFARARGDTIEEIRQSDTENKRELKKNMARLGASEIEGTKKWERRKNAKVAMLCSMVLPGLGQLYNGRRFKTVLAVGAFSFYAGHAILDKKESDRRKKARGTHPYKSFPWRQEDLFYEFYKENSRTYAWWAGAAWLIIVLDAFVDAHLFDVRAVTPMVVRGDGDANYLALSIDF